MLKLITPFSLLILFLVIQSPFLVAKKPNTIKEVMDDIITRLYESKNIEELSKLDEQIILDFCSDTEKHILATEYWTFNVNVPVVVSIMRHIDQPVVPFWLTAEAGFRKTELLVKNEEYTYQVWQKTFKTGRVELGINGFDKHRPVYFICVAPKNSEEKLELSDIFPENQFITRMDVGANIYHDWDELVLTEVPEVLIGQKLLTTIRGRAREAHLINAFRNTPFPSSEYPDQILLTWNDNPKTSQCIQWRTNTNITDGVVRFRENYSESDSSYNEISAECHILEDRLLINDRYIHRFNAKIQDLKPATKYVYSVGSPRKNIWSEKAKFITAPLDTSSFTFIYFGDTHRSPYWGKLVNTVYKRHPETAFYTIAGDVVSTGLYRDEWDLLFEYSSEVIRNRPVLPAPGNHDSQDGLGLWMYLDLFALPENGPKQIEKERTYSFEYSNALFLILDATLPPEDQVDWIEEQLSFTTMTWKFAVFHFPPYIYKSDYQDIRTLWGTVFDKYDLDMVFSGHIHTYVRSKPMFAGQAVTSPTDGTIYVTSVAIPAGDEEIPDKEYAEVYFSGGMLYQKIDICGSHLHYRCLDFEGNVRDSLKISKQFK